MQQPDSTLSSASASAILSTTSANSFGLDTQTSASTTNPSNQLLSHLSSPPSHWVDVSIESADSLRQLVAGLSDEEAAQRIMAKRLEQLASTRQAESSSHTDEALSSFSSTSLSSTSNSSSSSFTAPAVTRFPSAEPDAQETYEAHLREIAQQSLYDDDDVPSDVEPDPARASVSATSLSAGRRSARLYTPFTPPPPQSPHVAPAIEHSDDEMDDDDDPEGRLPPPDESEEDFFRRVQAEQQQADEHSRRRHGGRGLQYPIDSDDSDHEPGRLPDPPPDEMDEDHSDMHAEHDFNRMQPGEDDEEEPAGEVEDDDEDYNEEDDADVDLDDHDVDALAAMDIPDENASPEALHAFARLIRRADHGRFHGDPRNDQGVDGEERSEEGDEGDEDGEDFASRLLPLLAGEADSPELAAARQRLEAFHEEARNIAAQLRAALSNARAERERRRARRTAAEQLAAEHEARERANAKPVGIYSSFALNPHLNAVQTTIDHVQFPRPSEEKDLVTADQVTSFGRDIQGIPWHQLRLQREGYRANRIVQYPSLSGLLPMPQHLAAECTPTQRSVDPLFSFTQSIQSITPCYYHTQLRHLLHAPSNSYEVFAMASDDRIQWCNTQLNQYESVLDVEDEKAFDEARKTEARSAEDPAHHPPPSQVLYEFSAAHTLCSMGVAPPLLFLGEQAGELSVRNIHSGREVKRLRVTNASNAIVNAITFCTNPLTETITSDGTLLPASGSHAQRFLVSDNDSFARMYDLETFTPLVDYKRDMPVNYASTSPDGKLVSLGCDAHECWLMDSSSALVTHTLAGHVGDIFSTTHHPNLPLVATGAQDNTCRVWDLRATKQSLYCFPAEMSPIRSVKFARNGEFLVAAEGQSDEQQ